MKLFHILVLAVFAAGTSFALGEDRDPSQIIKDINQARTKAISDARQAGTQVDIQAIQKNSKESAIKAVKGIDPTKVDPKQAYAWATLFSMAEMHKEACAAASRFLTSSPTPEEKFRAQSLMMRSCNELGEADMLLMTLNAVNPPDASSSFQLASMTANVYVDTISDKMGMDEALKALDRVDSLLPARDKVTDKEKPQLYSTIAMLADARSELFSRSGKPADALAVLDKGIALLPEKDPNLRSLKAAKLRITMLEAPAPALSIERSHGEFPGLEGMKGKIVILDFFAHWCGPCIRSFDDMKKLYADLKPKGVEVVGVTTYYGYYKKENSEKRDMTRDAEFGKMADFIADYKLPWPVAFGERSNFEAYGITGIPQVVVIDRKGNVHKIKIGYTPELFAKFREDLEKLVDEK